MYPDAEKIILVMDNFNTHKLASLYRRYPLQEVRGINKKFEIHYTPKLGSWLDIAKIGQLCNELSAWEAESNKSAAKVNW